METVARCCCSSNEFDISKTSLGCTTLDGAGGTDGDENKGGGTTTDLMLLVLSFIAIPDLAEIFLTVDGVMA